jgi:hypothetical protein
LIRLGSRTSRSLGTRGWKPCSKGVSLSPNRAADVQDARTCARASTQFYPEPDRRVYRNDEARMTNDERMFEDSAFGPLPRPANKNSSHVFKFFTRTNG